MEGLDPHKKRVPLDEKNSTVKKYYRNMFLHSGIFAFCISQLYLSCRSRKKFKYKDDEFIRMWVADMEFCVAPEILDAVRNIIIRDAEERERFQSRDKLAGGLNPLSIEAHKAAYEKGGEWLRQLKIYLDDNLKLLDSFLKQYLPETVFNIPESTYLAWVDFSRYLPDEPSLPLFFANEAGVLLERGSELFVGNADGYVRLNVAMPRKTLETGLKRIRDAIYRRRNQKPAQ